MKALPFLLSIPHGGTKTPPLLTDRIAASRHDLFDDSDPFTLDIYDVGPVVRKVLKAKIYRAFIDLNRSMDKMPPEFPDGLIKSETCFGKSIYKPGCGPDGPLIKKLIRMYYLPYHRQLLKFSQNPEIKLGIDCHSMAPTAPVIAPDQGKKRPIFSLGNVENHSCDRNTVEILAESLCHVFGLKQNDVKINSPFKGGYITKAYGNNPIPWIQVEMNRDLYLHEKYFDRDSLRIDRKRLQELLEMFGETLYRFYQLLNW